MTIRRVLSLLAALSLALALSSCEKRVPGQEAAESAESRQEQPGEQIVKEEQAIASVCLADGVWIVDRPTYRVDEYKSITELALAEVVTWTGEEAEGENSKGTAKLPFVQVKTIDGKVGWVWSNYIARDAKPAAVVEKTSKYIKPSITSRESEYPLLPLDIAAVVEENGQWLKVYVQRDGSGTEWWIVGDHISYEARDINTAVLGKRALAMEDMEKRSEALNKILDNDILQGSLFMAQLQQELGSAPASFSGTGTINDDDVLLREAPTLDAAVVERLSKNEAVTISLRTKEEMEIQGMRAYWYRVKLESGSEGWTYGFFIDLD